MRARRPSPRARRWIVAGGIAGLALAPSAVRVGGDLRARLARARAELDDPVSAFCGAPCYEHDRATGRGTPRREAIS